MKVDHSRTLITSEEFEACVKTVWEKVADLLYPNTPIEVIVDCTPQYTQVGNRHQLEENGEFVYHFSLYVEGEWRMKAFSVRDAVAAVREVLKTDSYSWHTESTRLNADWEKWRHVSQSGLMEACGLGYSDDD